MANLKTEQQHKSSNDEDKPMYGEDSNNNK